MTKSLVKLAFTGMLTILSVGQTAKADLIPILQSALPSGSNTVFTYNVSLTTGSVVAGGGVNDFITMYDFRGYIPGSATVVNTSIGTWTSTEQAFGNTPASITPIDTALTNITFTYQSAPQIVGSGQTVLTFRLTSTLPLATGGQFTQYAGSSTNAANSTVQGNVGFIQGPNPVPEPSTFALLGVGGVLCTMYARRIRRDRTA